MANAMTPTAANIISSLGIKGATSDQNLPGFVPVLGADGRLSAKFIPLNAPSIAIPALSNVAYVDPYTSAEDGVRQGSIAAPFKSISEAASNFAPTNYTESGKQIAFVLAPGNYADSSVVFSHDMAPLSVYLICIGQCRLIQPRLVISGLGTSSAAQPRILLQGIVTNGEVAVAGTPSVTCIGSTYVHALTFGGSGGTLRLSSEARVDSTNAGTVLDLISDAAHVKNTSSVNGGTVEDALDRLCSRKVRLARITHGSTGFDIGSSYDDMSAESAGAYDVYDISRRDRLFAEGVNRILKDGIFTTINANTVRAKTVIADVVDATTFKIDALSIGGYRLEIDTYGYLVVVDGTDDPPRPPDAVALIRDTVNGALYAFSVSDGRLRLAYADRDDSSDSDSSDSDPSDYKEILDEMFVTDPDTGIRYRLYVENGRMKISVLDDSSI